MTKTRIAVLGGGRIGHLYAASFAQHEDIAVRLYSRQGAEMSQKMPQLGIKIEMPDGTCSYGRPETITSDIAEAVKDADLVLFTQTANGRPSDIVEVVRNLPTDKPVAIGGIPGCGCFDWLAETVVDDFERIAIFGFLDVPHTAARTDRGVSVEVGGVKAEAFLGFHERTPMMRRSAIIDLMRKLLPMPVHALNHFLEVTLIALGYMHPTVLYANFGPYSQWNGNPLRESFRWFTDLSELGGYFISRCDEEQQSLVRAVETQFGISLPMAEPLQVNLTKAYGTQIGDHRTLYSTLRSCSAYKSYLPMVKDELTGGLTFKKDHPILIEDTFYGMSYLVEMGRRLDVPMPYMQEIYDWSVDFLGGPQANAVDYMPKN
jgi:hypothetical protein